jgi:hypothetical protein
VDDFVAAAANPIVDMVHLGPLRDRERDMLEAGAVP